MREQDRKDYRLIKSKVEECGIDSQFDTVDMDGFREAQYKALGKHNTELVEFLVLREQVREIITNDLIWFDRWVTAKQDACRIEACHENCYYYLEHGLEPPKEYYSADSAIFQYNPKYRTNLRGEEIRVDKQVVLLPRTLGKTVLFLAQASVQNYMKHPNWKFYVIQGNEKKAKDNLTQIQKYLMNPWLVAVAPDLFAVDQKEYRDRGGKINRFTVDMPKPTVYSVDEIMEMDFDIRREATFTIGTPKMSATGQHYDCCYFDDIVDENTSKTPEAMEELSKWHGALMSLANETGIMERHYTGTRWWEFDLYEDIMNDASVFVMPARWEHEGETKFLSAMHNDDVLNDIRNEKGTGEWFDAHMQMIKRSVESDVSIVTDDSFMFAFPHEKAPGIKKLNKGLDDLKFESVVVSSFDPTYSSKNKGKRTTDSKATLGNGFIHEGTLYIYDLWQSLGWDLDDTDGPSAIDIMDNIYSENVLRHDVDWTVCDSQGTQKANTQKWFNTILKKSRHTVCKFHGKGSLTGTISKAERANMVLRERFSAGDIKIHYSLTAAIKEIKRETKGYDFLDILIQLCLPENVTDWEALSQHYKSVKWGRAMKRHRKKGTHKPKFKIAGY